MSARVYEMVAERIVAALEKGTVPWRRPWAADAAGEFGPRSLSTGKAYRGVNVLILGAAGYDSIWWGTFKEIHKRGGMVRKGEKATPIVFWSFVDRKNRETGEKERIPLLRYFNVFNRAQTEGLDGLTEPGADPRPEPERIAACEAIVAGYDGPSISHRGDCAGYSPALDAVTMPAPASFVTMRHYYATLFHELAHSTGHESRLKRLTRAGFGSMDYGREELVAETAAAFLATEAGIMADDLFENTAAYLANWIRVIREDPRAVVVAAGAAQKAADMIMGRKAEAETEAA